MEYCLRLGRFRGLTKKSHRQSRHDDTNDLVFEVSELFDVVRLRICSSARLMNNLYIPTAVM